ncbi:hypothetical protein DFP73DRAFT_568407 [Morchella snyderi]|nr:hypothetical protein DFP73DRAFT_568407 [Morchella snyderi]
MDSRESQNHTDMELPSSPISRLPPELLFRILTFVALVGGPNSLRSCNLTCKGFHDIIEDPTLDKYIYRAAAFFLLSHDTRLFPDPNLSGTRVPPSPTTKRQTFKAFARTLHLSRREFPAELHHPSTTSIPDANCPTTRYGPSYVARDWHIQDNFRTLASHKNEKCAAAQLPPLSVDPKGRTVSRIIDFVHSSTEAARTEEGVAYVGVRTCGWGDAQSPGKTSSKQGETSSWILFSDDPRVFPEKRDRGWITVQRAVILGGAPSASPSNVPLGQRLQQQHQEKVEALAGKYKDLKLDDRSETRGVLPPHGILPPPSARDIAEAEKAWSPFIKPVDHDKFMNAQRWGTVSRGVNASTYKALPRKKSSATPPPPQLDGDWFTVDKALWTMKHVSDLGLVNFAKSLLHSDANLRLVPRLVQKQLEVAAVERICMENADGEVEVNMAWKMPRSVKELSLEAPAIRDAEQEWDEEHGEITWEFKSCGKHLIICDDNSGRRASTVNCFAGSVPTGAEEDLNQNHRSMCSDNSLRWQRRMVVKGNDGRSGEYWLDNDGISMNSNVVAYSTRRHVIPLAGRPDRYSYKAVMEFHILSVQTGDTIKILNLAEEERDIADRCYMWCSFAIGDGVLVASLGGLGPTVRRDDDDGMWAGIGRRKKYGYENLFVWDLGDESSLDDPPQVGVFKGETEAEANALLVAPRSRIPTPQGWGELDKYITISGCGRYLGVCAEWKMAIWDMEQKTFEGLWRVGDADHLEVDSINIIHERDVYNRRDDECLAWNGLWIKWRDVIDAPDPSSSEPEVINQDVTFINSRDLRRAIGGVDLEMDRRRSWMNGHRINQTIEYDPDASESDSESVGSALMEWESGTMGVWEDAEEGYAMMAAGEETEGDEMEGESDADIGYMGTGTGIWP